MNFVRICENCVMKLLQLLIGEKSHFLKMITWRYTVSFVDIAALK